MYKNLRFYRVFSPWPATEAAVDARLERNAFKPCGPYTERSSGWEVPHGDALCRGVNGAHFLQLRTQSRVLPAAAIREALEERISDYAARMQEPPSRREVRRLQGEIRDELLPQALLKSERIQGCFLQSEQVLCIDAGSDGKAERFLDQLRPCMEQFEFAPLEFNKPLAPLLTALLLGEHIPGLQLGYECRMQDVSDKAAVAVWRNVDLQAADVQQHLAASMKLTHLAVDFESLLGGVLSELGTVSKIRLPTRSDDETASETDPLARADADCVLLSGAVRGLLQLLSKQLGGFRTGGDAAGTQASAA
ncbi:MAG: recombination-associated protein RdgC [Gammaproteobacteria bacterium]|jgi:recombination associated protein RdgC|nr:recombination-associated protein RdgC [Gammaproteobacteria bacterium]